MRFSSDLPTARSGKAHCAVKELCVSPWLGDKGRILLQHTRNSASSLSSHIYSLDLTYKCSCTIYFHAWLSNNPDLNEDDSGMLSHGEYDFEINMLKCKIIFHQTDKCFCLREQCLWNSRPFSCSGNYICKGL